MCYCYIVVHRCITSIVHILHNVLRKIIWSYSLLLKLNLSLKLMLQYYLITILLFSLLSVGCSVFKCLDHPSFLDGNTWRWKSLSEMPLCSFARSGFGAVSSSSLWSDTTGLFDGTKRIFHFPHNTHIKKCRIIQYSQHWRMLLVK